MTQHKQHLNELLDIIFQWDKALRNLERKFNKDFNLTLNQCRLILYIHDKNYVELSQVNKWLNIDKSTTTRMIRPLLVNGFIDKFYQFGDKRKIYLKISETGMDNVGEIQNEFDKIVNESLTKVPAGKRDFTFQTVRDLLKVM
ncbi:MAG: MarR family winged helix-turn-helix transcriptional regulator [Chitinophagales bacterium]|jgi:DNA-binding MarR family transcriptional regulator